MYLEIRYSFYTSIFFSFEFSFLGEPSIATSLSRSLFQIFCFVGALSHELLFPLFTVDDCGLRFLFLSDALIHSSILHAGTEFPGRLSFSSEKVMIKCSIKESIAMLHYGSWMDCKVGGAFFGMGILS